MDLKDKDLAELLTYLGEGKQQDLAAQVGLLYSELRRLAAHYLKHERPEHTLQATALVHEAYLRLVEQRQAHWENKDQFLGIAAQLMRRILVDYGRNRNAAKRGGDAGRVVLDEGLAFAKERAPDVVALDAALKKLASLDARQARIVELRFFGGLSIEQVAAITGISPATVKRNWNVSKAWLARELGHKHRDV